MCPVCSFQPAGPDQGPPASDRRQGHGSIAEEDGAHSRYVPDPIGLSMTSLVDRDRA